MVMYESDNPSNCLEVGSIGPCPTGSECGMTASKTNSGVNVTYTYDQGCRNTLTMDITHGSADSQLGPATQNGCSYSVVRPWAVLPPPSPPPTQYVCSDSVCQQTTGSVDAVGLSKSLCSAVCQGAPNSNGGQQFTDVTVLAALISLFVGLACGGGLAWRRHRQIVLGGTLLYRRPHSGSTTPQANLRDPAE